MKYILKKDLPFAKAGQPIEFHQGKLASPNITVEFRSEDHHLHIWADSISRLINEGWVEEVKPREFFINVGNEAVQINQDMVCNVYYAYPIEKCKGKDLQGYIKVQEVLK